MTNRYAATIAAPIFILAALAATPASADPLPYGPDTCIQGYVWREARAGDTVCVTSEMRAIIAQQNGTSGANKDPNAGSGPQSCSQGYVWREAFDGDTICVTPDFRAQVKGDNAAASSRKAASSPQPTPTPATGHSVVFEVTGSGTVYTIDIDPGGRVATENTAVPWKKAATIGSDVQLLQVVAVAKTGSQGCRITLDGKVVADQPNDSHCVYALP
jgi:hypothetical protein